MNIVEKLQELKARIQKQGIIADNYFVNGKCGCVIGHMADLIDDEVDRAEAIRLLQLNEGFSIGSDELRLVVDLLYKYYKALHWTSLSTLQYYNDLRNSESLFAEIDHYIEKAQKQEAITYLKSAPLS